MVRPWPAAVAAACLALAPGAPPGNPAGPSLALTSAGPTSDSSPADPAGDPVRFFVHCRDRARAEVRGYRAILDKQERIRGELHPPEELDASVRLEPFAVRMRWRSGARDVLGVPVAGIVYATGENKNRMTVWRPAASLSFLRHIDVTPTAGDARSAARYAITEASLVHAAERTVRVWTAARAAGTLDYTYDGVRRDDRTGGRACHVFTRRSDPPQADAFLLNDAPPPPGTGDAIARTTLFVDTETGLQVGAELRRTDGELVGAYFFRDVRVNPAFAPGEFTRAGLAE